MKPTKFRTVYDYEGRNSSRGINEPWYKRLTPFTWVLVVLSLVGLLFGGLAGVRLWATRSVAKPAAIPTAIVLAQPLPKVAPVVADQPKAKSTAVVKQAQIKPTIAAEQVDLSSSLSMSPVEEAFGGTTKVGSGKGNQIVEHVKQYYDAMKKMPLHMYLGERDAMIPVFFYGKQLDKVLTAEKERTEYEYWKEGDVQIRVLRIANDGKTALVSVKQMDWVQDVYEVPSGRLTLPDVKPDPLVQLWRVVYDAASKRWKIAEDLSPKSADGAPVVGNQ